MPLQMSYAFLAESGQFTPDGKLWVLGGDIDTLIAHDFPLVYPSLTLLVKLLVPEEDALNDHRLRAYLTGPGNEETGRETDFMFTTPLEQAQVAQPNVGFALAFQLLRFEQAGAYAFHIVVDGHELKILPLNVTHRTATTPQLSVRPTPQS